MVTNHSRKKTQMVWSPSKTSKEAPVRLAYEEVTQKPVKKLKGGQPLTWLKTIERDLNSINLTVEEARNIAQDRDRYLQEVVIRVRDEAEPKASPAEEF